MAVCLACIGCDGSNVVPIEGTVQYQGEPVAGIEIVFTPENGPRPSYGSTDENGHFRMTYTVQEMGVAKGKQAVTFDWEGSSDGSKPSEAINAILAKHGENGEPLEYDITKGDKNMVINIE